MRRQVIDALAVSTCVRIPLPTVVFFCFYFSVFILFYFHFSLVVFHPDSAIGRVIMASS